MLTSPSLISRGTPGTAAEKLPWRNVAIWIGRFPAGFGLFCLLLECFAVCPGLGHDQELWEEPKGQVWPHPILHQIKFSLPRSSAGSEPSCFAFQALCFVSQSKFSCCSIVAFHSSHYFLPLFLFPDIFIESSRVPGLAGGAWL